MAPANDTQQRPGVVKRYRFRGVRFRQLELTYEEDVKLREIIPAAWRSYVAGGQQANDLAAIVDRLFEQNVIREVIRIVLKPDEPTLVHRWLNRLRARRSGIDPDDPILRLHNSEIARVLADFFTINSSWISAYLILSDSSLLKADTIPIIQGLPFILKNPFTTSPTATSA